ncbi:ABC transporter ATP-binding protein [Agaricicola taiwanensis]|uniref:ABC transporter ATP-binding protein n=1 Tax=Agaricicola taiwanensis TaxID=591372 RepID=A0A8J2YHR6_9RHOB|nr:ABC transporter ATP-binding protein [Agaricicola taiwanensis]GGE43447.1 ABC transporter ATP-binding protein [Agaricicola taiwanensis]
MRPLLEITGVTKRFRGLVALDNINLALAPGEIVGLIGPNGAGKTTLVNVITGVHKADEGDITFSGRSIKRERPDRIARLGIARTFQVVQPFPAMTVLENVTAAALFAGGAASIAEARDAAAHHLEFCGLADQAGKPASALTLAGRKRLELAKSLALRPKLLMLDEVNAGLNPAEIDNALELIASIANRGITIFLIEHLMKVVTRTAQRVIVLHHGRLIADGPVAQVLSDETVVEAYLGRRFAERMAGAGI